MKVTNRRSFFARSIAVSTAALIGTALTPLAASAQDSTWTGPGTDYVEGANWMGGIPTNLATFSNTGPANVVIPFDATINEILFAANAQQYTLTNSASLTVNGIGANGIVNGSPLLQTIRNFGTITFNNNATLIGGTAGIFIENRSNAGSSPALIFNNNSGLGANVFLLSYGAAASAVGDVQLGASGSVTFNNSSFADGVTMTFSGGTASAQSGAASATGIGGAHGVTFNDASHADGADISNEGGLAITLAQAADPLFVATAIGGSSGLTFNNSSHADNATIENRGASATALILTGSATSVGGNANLTLNDSSHIDGVTLTNIASLTSGTGGVGGDGTGVAGGIATTVGGNASTIFNDGSHADNSTFVNSGGVLNLAGGNGGAGTATAGGAGGAGIGVSGGASIVFNGSSHANNSSFAMTSGTTTVSGGSGGAGGTTGAGGNGGVGSGTGGGTLLLFNNGTGVTGATITNNAGDAVAFGGTGGAGGAGAAGGAGGISVASGSAAGVTFVGTASAGTGTTIVNQAGNGTATGGLGGAGGTAAGGDGGQGGDASAQGGNATILFQDNASAGSAVITNTAGTGTITVGSGGNGDTGNGGNGGSAQAQGGDATIRFNNNATAGSAMIVNNGSAPLTTNPGVAGTAGAGGGIGGTTGGGAVSSGVALVEFNGNATGGSARITNNGGQTVFNDSSVFGTAAGALITNNALGTTAFNGLSSLGSGTVQNNAGGSLIFSDTSTAGTGTINNALGGGVSFLDGSTSGSATIINANGGNVLYAGNSLAGTSVISNAGTLSFIGSADAVAARVVNGATGTVSIGVNALRIGSLAGAGTVNNNGNTIQVGYLDLNDTFSGVISGAGGLLKRGNGTLVLTGANTYTGQTVIFGGTLQVDGSLASGVAVSAGTILRGVGTIAGALSNNGIINPGNTANPLGTLVVTPSVTFNNGSILAPTISSAGQSSLLQAGSLFINAGTVRPTALTGGLFLMQTDYKIAVGSAGRNGTFTGVDESLLPTFLDASLFYTPTEVFLRVRRNATNFAQTANLTPNQSALSTALDAAVTAADPDVYGTYLTTYNTLLLQGTNGPLQAALDTLSGDALTVVPGALQDQASRFAHRLDAYTWSNSSNVWGLIAYGDQDADGDGNGPGFNADGLEFQIGFNTSLGANTRLGLSLGYNDGDLDSSDRLVTADIETWSLGAQLRHDFGPVYASGQLTYSWHNVDTSRGLLLGGLANAGFDATTWTAGLEIGGVFRTGQLSIEPHVSLRYANTEQDAYSETGPVGVLNVVAADYETTRLGLGVRLANREPTAPVRFYALLRYEHELGDEQSVLDNTLPGLPTYRVLGTRLGDDIFTADVGVEFQVSQGLSVFAAGGGHTRSNETSLNANAGLRIRF